MSQIRANIAHQDYVLTCPDEQAQWLEQAIEQLNTTMTQLRHSGKVRTREQAATLVALHATVEQLTLRAQLEELQAQLAALQQTTPSSVSTEDAQLAVQALDQLRVQCAADALRCQDLVQRLDQVLAIAPTTAPEATEATQPVAVPAPAPAAENSGLPASSGMAQPSSPCSADLLRTQTQPTTPDTQPA